MTQIAYTPTAGPPPLKINSSSERKEQAWWEAPAHVEPVESEIFPSQDTLHVRETERQIEECRNLEADWDGEDALPATQETIDLGKRLVNRLACETETRRLSYPVPTVSLDPAGRLHLLWRAPRLRVLVIMNGGPPEQVVVVETAPDREPTREVTTLNRAVERILAAFSLTAAAHP